MLILRLDTGEQLDDGGAWTELIAGKRGNKAILALEGDRHVSAVVQKRALVTAEAAYGAEPHARLVESLAEGIAAAHIAARVIVVVKG
jgi:hypothetical protein